MWVSLAYASTSLIFKLGGVLYPYAQSRSFEHHQESTSIPLISQHENYFVQLCPVLAANEQCSECDTE